MGSVNMEDKIDLESDEGSPLTISHPPAADTPQSFHFETSPRIFPNLHLTPFRSIYVVLYKAKINVLLPFGPLAIILHYLTPQQQHGWVFFFSLLGITPLAERLGYATEQLACYTGHTVGGLLNATFGNATEMIISIYALKNGMIRVVQQSLLGSILSNMLLVLGCAFFTGGIVHYPKVQVFNKSAAIVSSGLLLMAVMGILFPAVLHFTHTEVHFGKSELALSRFSSCIMLVAYASYLFFQLKSHSNLYDSTDEERENNGEDSDDEEVPEITKWEAISWLTILTLWVSVLSGYLVDAIQELLQFILEHVDDRNVETFLEGLLEARQELRPLLCKPNDRLKDLLLLDIALDSIVRTAIERSYEDLSNAKPEKVIYLITLLLENLILSSDNNEDQIYCLKGWNQALSLLETGDGSWALFAKSDLDRTPLSKGELYHQIDNLLFTIYKTIFFSLSLSYISKFPKNNPAYQAGGI